MSSSYVLVEDEAVVVVVVKDEVEDVIDDVDISVTDGAISSSVVADAVVVVSESRSLWLPSRRRWCRMRLTLLLREE
jgi:hypothetical protein